MTKQEKSAIEPEREPTRKKTGVTSMRVTPEMIKAGALELTASYGEESSDAVVVAIYEEMEGARLQGLRNKRSRRQRKR